MTVFTRMNRLFKADLHGLLDSVEEPQALLQQSIREMEDEIESGESRLKAHRFQVQEIEEEITRIEKRLIEIDSELDLCLAESKEDLARGLVRQKLSAQNQIVSLNTRSDRLKREIERLEECLAEQREKLEAIVSRKAAYATSDSEEVCQTSAPAGFSDNEVEIALLKEKQKRAQKGKGK